MGKRMSSTERRKRLRKIMKELYKKAQHKSDFRAEMIAEKEGVSTVLVYRLIGPEFQQLRSKLKGPGGRYAKTDRQLLRENAELRSENKQLRRELRETHKREKVRASEELSEAIKFIEQQDEIIRIIDSERRTLRQRLAESEMVIMPPSLLETEYKIKRLSVTSRITP